MADRQATIAMQVGIDIWIGRAMDGSVDFEEAADLSITPALLKVFTVLSWQKWCS